MGKYALFTKSGELVSTIVANNIEEAINIFCFNKKFDKYILLHLFDVIKI